MTDILKEIKDKVDLAYYYMVERLKNSRQLLLNLDERLQVSSPINKLQLEKKLITNLVENLHRFYKNNLSDKNHHIHLLTQSLQSPEEKILRYRETIDVQTKRLYQLYRQSTEFRHYQHQTMLNKLEGLNPLKIMQRGFSLTTKNDKVITSIEQIHIDDTLKIDYKDGHAKVKVLSKEGKDK